MDKPTPESEPGKPIQARIEFLTPMGMPAQFVDNASFEDHGEMVVLSFYQTDPVRVEKQDGERASLFKINAFCQARLLMSAEKVQELIDTGVKHLEKRKQALENAK